jgi:hypothetical protein
VSRVIKPINIRTQEHEVLLRSAKALRMPLKEYIECVLVVYMASVLEDKCVKFEVPQKTQTPKAFAISVNIARQVKEMSCMKGVSQVNFIYSAMMWHLAVLPKKVIS